MLFVVVVVIDVVVVLLRRVFCFVSCFDGWCFCCVVFAPFFVVADFVCVCCTCSRCVLLLVLFAHCFGMCCMLLILLFMVILCWRDVFVVSMFCFLGCCLCLFKLLVRCC